MKEKIRKNISPKYTFHPPELHGRTPCDFRICFDAGSTLKDIAAKYHCDQRTVRTCIILNKSSYELGRQYAPTKLSPYAAEAEALYWQLTEEQALSLTQASREITAILASRGYAGSERTVRNYLKAHCLTVPIRKSQGGITHAQDHNHAPSSGRLPAGRL